MPLNCSAPTPMAKTGTIAAVWPEVTKPPDGVNVLIFPELIPNPPVSWSAVTIKSVLGFSLTNATATPMA